MCDALVGSATDARPLLSRMIKRFAVAEDVAPWMPLVASMWLLAAASVVAGASYQLVAPVIARMRFANQSRICRRLPVFPLGAWEGSRVRWPISTALMLLSMRLRSDGCTMSAPCQLVFGVFHPCGAVLTVITSHQAQESRPKAAHSLREYPAVVLVNCRLLGPGVD